MTDTDFDAATETTEATPSIEQESIVENQIAPEIIENAETPQYTEESQSSSQEMLLREVQDLKRQNAEILAQRQNQTSSSQIQDENVDITPTDIVRQALNEIRQQEQELEAQKFHKEYARKLYEGPNRFKDFENVVVPGGKSPFSDAMIEIIKASDDPAAVLYHAAKNHSADLAKISAMPNPLMQAREMVRLEDRIKSSLKVRTVSRASSPMNDDIGSAGNSDGGDVTDTDAMAKFLLARSKQR